MLPIYLQVVLVSALAIYVVVEIIKLGNSHKPPSKHLHHH